LWNWRGDAIVLKPAVKLSKLRGISKIKDAAKKLEELRREWDEETGS